MIHIIPHQTEILKFVNIQKKITSTLQAENVIFIQKIPLSFPLFEKKESLQLIGKSIVSIKISEPESSYKYNQIFSKVQIYLNDGKIINTKLILFDLIIKSSETNFPETFYNELNDNLKKICMESDFPCILKIFRITDITSNQKDSTLITEVIESHWIKLKNN